MNDKNDDLADLMAALDKLDQSKNAPTDAEKDGSPSAEEPLARASVKDLFTALPEDEEEDAAIANLPPARPRGMAPQVEAQSDEEVSDEETLDEKASVIYHYRVVAALLPEMEMKINTARQAAELDIAEAGSFALYQTFKAEDESALVVAVRGWAEAHLPLKLTLDRVTAVVRGANRYIAGWFLTPARELKDAQAELVKALDPLIEILPDPGALPFTPRLIVSDFTPAEKFPRLIYELQTRFQRDGFTLSELEILRVPEGDDRWEVAEKISGRTP